MSGIVSHSGEMSNQNTTWNGSPIHQNTVGKCGEHGKGIVVLKNIEVKYKSNVHFWSWHLTPVGKIFEVPFVSKL